MRGGQARSRDPAKARDRTKSARRDDSAPVAWHGTVRQSKAIAWLRFRLLPPLPRLPQPAPHIPEPASGDCALYRPWNVGAPPARRFPDEIRAGTGPCRPPVATCPPRHVLPCRHVQGHRSRGLSPTGSESDCRTCGKPGNFVVMGRDLLLRVGSTPAEFPAFSFVAEQAPPRRFPGTFVTSPCRSSSSNNSGHS